MGDSVESVRTMCRHHLLAVLQPLIAVQVFKEEGTRTTCHGEDQVVEK